MDQIIPHSNKNIFLVILFGSAPSPILHIELWKVSNLQGILYTHDKWEFGYKVDDNDGYGFYFSFFIYYFFSVWFWSFVIIQQFAANFKESLERQSNL